MNMYGWSTWGNVDLGDANENYRKYGRVQLFKHWTGPIVCVPESTPRHEAFLMLAQMNEYLADLGDGVPKSYEEWKESL